MAAAGRVRWLTATTAHRPMTRHLELGERTIGRSLDPDAIGVTPQERGGERPPTAAERPMPTRAAPLRTTVAAVAIRVRVDRAVAGSTALITVGTEPPASSPVHSGQRVSDSRATARAALRRALSTAGSSIPGLVASRAVVMAPFAAWPPVPVGPVIARRTAARTRPVIARRTAARTRPVIARRTGAAGPPREVRRQRTVPPAVRGGQPIEATRPATDPARPVPDAGGPMVLLRTFDLPTTRSSSPGAARWRKRSSRDDRRTGSWWYPTGGTRWRGWSCTRPASGSRSWRSRAAR